MRQIIPFLFLSLLFACQGETENRPDRPVHEFVASESVGVDGKPGQGHRMVRTKDWKYILTGTNEEVLYHEGEDPLEQYNLIDENPVQAEQMRRMMADWMNRTGDLHEQIRSEGGNSHSRIVEADGDPK